MLRSSKRPLVIGMGGGGDVVGALATAEFARLYDGASPVLGGIGVGAAPDRSGPGAAPASRRSRAPRSSRRRFCWRARDATCGSARSRPFAESRMAEFLGQPTVLITLEDGPAAIAIGLAQAVGAWTAT